MFPTVDSAEIERALLDYLQTTFHLRDKQLEAALFKFLRDEKTGKTECFLYPVLDHCRRARQRDVRGIKAIILYPMNTLASDQAERLAKLLRDPPGWPLVPQGVPGLLTVSRCSINWSNSSLKISGWSALCRQRTSMRSMERCARLAISTLTDSWRGAAP